MSLYNMLMGHNPAMGILCAAVGIYRENVTQFGRLRDIWISEDADTIGILHRNYGEEGAAANAAAEALPLFREHQETDDNTYRCWIFDAPGDSPIGHALLNIAELSDNTPCWKRYKQAVDDFSSGKKTEQTKHMFEVGKQIFEGLAKSFKDGEDRTVDTPDGSVEIFTAKPKEEEE